MPELPSAGPTVLGAFVQLHLATIEDHSDLAAAIPGRVSPESLKTIREASRLTRLPLAIHAELTRALFELAGESRARGICRTTVLASFSQPFLDALVRGALEILGTDLARLARWAPKAWGVLFRGAGEMTWELCEGGGDLSVRGAPAELRDDAVYLMGLGAGYEALFDLAGISGELRVRASEEEIALELRWPSAQA